MIGSGLRAAGGIGAAVLTLGAAELVAVVIDPGSAPLTAIGSTVVDRTPDAVREWAIQSFGTHDKSVLFASMAVVAVVVAAGAGLVERPRRPFGSALFVLFAVVAALAAVQRPGASGAWMAPTIVGVMLGIVALRWVSGRVAAVRRDAGAPGDAAVRGGVPPRGDDESPDPVWAGEGLRGRKGRMAGPATSADPSGRSSVLGRRQAVRGIVSLGALGVVLGVTGRLLGSRARSVAPERDAIRLPQVPEVPLDPAADLRLPGLTPYLTNNAEFYRIDTALWVPQVSAETWSLRIHGMVEREIRLDYAELVRRPAVERLVTLSCVSNPVGGDLVGNARWLGYRLDDLLAEARPHPDADMVLSRSDDGFTAGSPLAALTDGRDALLAVGMNGVPLPIEHGYPARLVVPGLYGYVSATKWVTELEITRFDRAQAYWTRRGWSERGPIKTGTRIDTPRAGARSSPGRITVAGVAWAQHRGIAAVEVQVDEGPWQPARLATEPSLDTWRQWSYDWDAPAGTHTVRARATDGTGQIQTAEVRDVLPDGASGYPSAVVRVG